jgi:hypothetical protein
MTAEGPDTVSAGLVGDALQVDHYARLVTPVHALWPDHGEVARPGYHLLPVVRDDRHPVRRGSPCAAWPRQVASLLPERQNTKRVEGHDRL